MIGAGWTLGFIGIGLAYVLPHLPWLRSHMSRRDHAGSAQIAFRFNSFIGLALADRIAGPTGIQWIAVLIGVCVPPFNVAVWPMARHGERFLARAGTQPADSGHRLGAAGQSGWLLHSRVEPTVSRLGAASLALG